MFARYSYGEGGYVGEAHGYYFLHNFRETWLQAKGSEGFGEAIIAFAGFWDRDDLGVFPVIGGDRKLK